MLLAALEKAEAVVEVLRRVCDSRVPTAEAVFDAAIFAADAATLVEFVYDQLQRLSPRPRP